MLWKTGQSFINISQDFWGGLKGGSTLTSNKISCGKKMQIIFVLFWTVLIQFSHKEYPVLHPVTGPARSRRYTPSNLESHRAYPNCTQILRDCLPGLYRLITDELGAPLHTHKTLILNLACGAMVSRFDSCPTLFEGWMEPWGSIRLTHALIIL